METGKKGKVTNLTFSKKVDLQNLVVLPPMEAEFSLEITQSLESGILEGSEGDLVWADELTPQDFIAFFAFFDLQRGQKSQHLTIQMGILGEDCL